MGHANLIHTGLKAHLMLCAIMVDLQDLFSRKHRFPFFCKSSEDLSPLQDAVLRMLTLGTIAIGTIAKQSKLYNKLIVNVFEISYL